MATQRQRSRIACEHCRKYKKKCNGEQPCSLCHGYGYECRYRATARKRRDIASSPTPSSSQMPLPDPAVGQNMPGVTSTPLRDSGQYVQSLESNSGAAFVRTLAMKVDPSRAHPIRTLAWNVFLGERQTINGLLSQSITNILSRADMIELAASYFAKVDPCYGFIDRDSLDQYIAERWLPDHESTLPDAVLAGVAALGCLFTHNRPLDVESHLVTLAKSILEFAISKPASVHSATGWVLRTVYLRLTAQPDEAWMTSSMALLNINAAGLHCEPNPNAVFPQPEHDCTPDIRRRIFGVAQHLNNWMSFDLGRSRVSLQNATSTAPSPRPNDYTTELLDLLPYSERLDPGKPLNGAQLGTALSDVLQRTHTQPPSLLAQTNLMLCIYRRLHVLKWAIPSDTLDKALGLIGRSFEAVHAAVSNESPWHHVANVPFQAICTLLAMDTPQSLALLGDGTASLVRVHEAYQTTATKEAVAGAHALIDMHQKRRMADVERQSEMLKLYPVSQALDDWSNDDFALPASFADSSWLEEFMLDFDVGAFGDGRFS